MFLISFFRAYLTPEYDFWLLMCNLFVTLHKLVTVLLKYLLTTFEVYTNFSSYWRESLLIVGNWSSKYLVSLNFKGCYFVVIVLEVFLREVYLIVFLSTAALAEIS